MTVGELILLIVPEWTGVVQFPMCCSCSNCCSTKGREPFGELQIHVCSNYCASRKYYENQIFSGTFSGVQYSCLFPCPLSIPTTLATLEFFKLAGRLVGVQIHFALVIVLLMLFLTFIPKGTGAFWGNSFTALLAIFALTGLTGLGAF